MHENPRFGAFDFPKRRLARLSSNVFQLQFALFCHEIRIFIKMHPLDMHYWGTVQGPLAAKRGVELEAEGW